MTVTVAFLGDTLLGGAAQETLDTHGYAYALAGIAPLWAGADLVVANHEAPLTTAEHPAEKADTGRKRYWYKGNPESAQTLAAHRIGVVSLANNHVADFGPTGLLDTMDALDSAGIAHCGAGPSDREARMPAIVEVNGIRLGFLSVMQRYQMYLDEDVYARRDHPGPALLRMNGLRQDIASLRDQVDICVVLVHWGRNYKPLTALQERLAAQIVEAGADLIVGHHPHVPHPSKVVDGVHVLYSLGNAAFGSPGRFHGDRPPYGLIAIAELGPNRPTRLDLKLISVDNAVVNYQPVPATGEAAYAFLDSLRDD